ncbi:hypothetical protein C8J57DRAFT_1494262 [Mycena rebaudengoi]|nr:hypothetical protein C8J57DRAFT_1494262 [Mycena rebaudengoi]
MVSKREPVTEVHVDQTVASATARVHLHLPPELAPSLLEHRFQIINLWRPIGHPAFDMPLTLCDFRTVDAERDWLRNARARRTGFDSAEGVSVLTPHTAFLDPSMPEGSPPRESIELRALVFYD